MPEAFIDKGYYIEASWLEAKPFGAASLAGMQLKTTATARSVRGTVRHIRSSDPNFQKDIMLFIQPTDGDEGTLCNKCGVKEIEVKPEWITRIVPKGEDPSAP
ncbi:MAG: hypothetical protein WC708_00045 [Lentisphaeria bacterium]|jgi:hypothetical protein